MMDFRDKVIVVTGAGRAIGAAIAVGFAAAGGAVAVNYRSDRAAADRVVERCRAGGGEAIAMQADVTQADAVVALMQQVMDEFGRIDALVNNAFAAYAF